MRAWRWILTLLIIAWAATVVAYGVSSMKGQTTSAALTPPKAGELSVAIEPVSFAPEKGSLTVSVTVVADKSRLDGSGGLVNPIGISMEPVLENGFTLVAKGALPGSFQRTIQLRGNSETYPFDHYSAPLVIAAAENANGAWQPLTVIGGFTRDGMSGWNFKFTPGQGQIAASDADAGQVFAATEQALDLDVGMSRTVSTMAISTLAVLLMAVLAILALVGVRAVAYGRRKQEMTMTSWFAAMIFALLPLRLALPGAPPLGAWIDILVTFWVLIVLMVSLAWWIVIWLRGVTVKE